MDNSSPVATWKPIAGFGDYYEVSDHGQVRSVDRLIQDSRGWMRQRRGQVLSQSWAGGGTTEHLKVGLSVDGVQYTKYVHQLVLETFVSPRPPGLEGCHNDGDPSNNRVSNLRWDTPTENRLDCIRHGNNVAKNRTACPREHLLVAPNLRNDSEGRSARRCLACLYAGNFERMARQRGEEFDFDAEADIQYRMIMSGEKVPGQRRAPVRLSHEQISEIAALLRLGVKQVDIGERFGVGQERISRVKRSLST